MTDRSTQMFVIGLGICVLFAAGFGVDYWLYKTGRPTLSNRAKALWKSRRGEPWFWLMLGLAIGFAIGVVVGFVGGHLFWPQYAE